MISMPSDGTLKQHVLGGPLRLEGEKPILQANQPNLDPKTTTSPSRLMTGSPSKSIIKTASNPSPKKVGFTNTAEVHHYNHPDSTIISDTSQAEVATQYDAWNDEDEGTPPAPPPHHFYETDQVDLNALKLNQNLSAISGKLLNSSISSARPINTNLALSLDEKFQLFMDLKRDTMQLDTRLTELNKEILDAADSNIHSLSLSIQSPSRELLSAQSTHSHHLDTSFGSSQSSLQSLKEDNRVLESVKVNNTSEGITMNDGIKGIPDDLAETLINNQEPSTHSPINRSGDLEKDSFDNSYFNAEQSIMNLLNGSHGTITTIKEELDLPVLPSKEITVKEEPDIKEEPIETNNPIVPARPIRPKQEFAEKESNHGLLKSNAPPVVQPVTSVSQLKINTSVYPLVETASNEQMKIIPQADESQASIRFNVDSDWKMEHSNDGDREDNDDYTNNDITAASVNNMVKIDFERLKSEQNLDELSKNVLASKEVSSPKHEDTSETQTKAEPTVPNVDVSEVQDDDSNPHESSTSKYDESLTHGNEGKSTNRSLSTALNQRVNLSFTNNVLANSSNIAPPEEITLPIMETNNSFEEFARSLALGTFEQSLSAEFEPENSRATDFISIWHSQHKQKPRQNQRSDEYFRVIGAEEQPETIAKEPMEPLEVSARSLPSKFTLQLQPKKFKEVHVKSRRIVSPDYDDLNVSGFLPELSDDSGFENHFKFLKRGNSSVNYSNAAGNRNSFTPLSTKNVLKNINNPNILEPPQPNTPTPVVLVSRPVNYATLRPHKEPVKPIKPMQPKKSRFIVPSFEIKRSSSILSPRDTYNEIFEDVVRVPTIKGEGMKTLPSMDRDDVKRIMSTKRVITQEEYKNIKLWSTSKKPSVNLPITPFDDLQQHALICNASEYSRDDEQSEHPQTLQPQIEEQGGSDEDILPHLANELGKTPEALLSADQLFNDYDIFGSKQPQEASRVSSVIHNKKADRAVSGPTLPEPDADIVNSVIFKTPPKPHNYDAPEDLDEELKLKYQYLNNKISPTKTIKGMKRPESPKTRSEPTQPESPKKSPIKIGSPVVLVRNGNVVTGVRNSSLVNQKIRDRPNVDSSIEGAHQDSPYSPITNETILEEDFIDDESSYAPKEHTMPEIVNAVHTDDTTSLLHERGRLFLRVVGLKNIELPELNDRHGEFSITLDNGVHCIKTPSYKLESNHVAIGKEFELTVGGSLEFILTMKATYDKPKGGYTEVKETRVVKPKNRISRMFGSKEIITTTKVVPIDVLDSWANKFAQDGSFARCYVDLEQFEENIVGQTGNFNLTCYNEWETKTNDKGEVIAKRQPYKIGELEVKMLFVPRQEADEILPTSIKCALESIDGLKKELEFEHEGYLHQEGGDCDTWKRRYFKLKGTSLIAHSEYSHKTRAKINLAKVVDVIYLDKENWNEKSYRNFSGVLLLEHAFKIKFANGEIIDFGAPNKQEKTEWIKIMERIVKRNRFRRQPWVKLMLENSEFEQVTR